MALRLPFAPSTASSSCSSTSTSRFCFHSLSSQQYLIGKSCIGASGSKDQLIRRFDVATFARSVDQASGTTAGGLVEVTQETFWPVVEAAGDRLVVVDMYTQWCGPCKIMYPKLVQLSAKYTDVLFLKLDCNQDNKALAKSLGIKVVPTFKLFKNRKEIAEVKGAKYDELLQIIKQARES